MTAEEAAAVAARLLRSLAELQRLQVARLTRLAKGVVELDRAAKKRAEGAAAR